jgi:tetratricopeptide (TPR) repeat protein
MQNLLARALVDLGNVFLSVGRYDLADTYYTQVRDLARRAKARRTEARAAINLASSKLQQWQPDEALDYIKQALPFYEQGNYRREVLVAYLLTGRAQRIKGDYEGALRTIQERLPAAEEAGDQGLIAQMHESIGSVLLLQERYRLAWQHFSERYTRSKTAGHKVGEGYGQAELAEVLWRMGHAEEARAALTEALAIAEPPNGGGGNKDLAVLVHVTGAESALAAQHWPEARAEASRALASAGTRYVDGLIRANLVLGLAQARAGRAAEGVRLCQEALTQAQQIGYPALVNAATLALAEAQLASGDANSALTNVLHAEENFARAGSLDSDWRAWFVAARAAARTGQTDKARDYAARAQQALAALQRTWGTEDYERYLTRPDVLLAQTQLNQLLAANP